MKILVTGANGFVGKNLIETLKNIKDGKDKTKPNLNIEEIYECTRETTDEELKEYTKNCDFVYHLAGVNRPEKIEEFMEGNYEFTNKLLDNLLLNNNKCPVMISSSIQAELDNDYGKSKKAEEDLLFNYSKENNVNVYVYRLPNLFGKWCKPNYNSVIATFCYNIANDLDITVNDENKELTLAYIDDVIDEILKCLTNEATNDGNFYKVSVTHTVTLGEIVKLLNEFKQSRNNLLIPNMENNSFSKKLYSTYLSYLPTDKFSYQVKMNVDDRGSFTELFKSMDRGQVSVNVAHPGITKGNHWHHTKNEKFVVVSGEGLIQFRKVGESDIIEYRVSGEKIEVVDIPTGYTHNIINVGDTDLVTVMWCNEIFNPDKPDTYFEEV